MMFLSYKLLGEIQGRMAKEQVDIGNERAETWIPSVMKRFTTEEAKSLAKVIIKTDTGNCIHKVPEIYCFL